MNSIAGNTGVDIRILIVLLIVIAAALTAVTISMSIRLSRLSRRYHIFMKGKDGQSMEKLFAQKFRELERVAERGENHQYDIGELKKKYSSTLNKYGIVKYDAFDDVGGKMSFALAMLDSENTGFILDAIHSRDNCFLYLKEIVKGESYIMLSNEEIEALNRAVNSGEEDVM